MSIFEFKQKSNIYRRTGWYYADMLHTQIRTASNQPATQFQLSQKTNNYPLTLPSIQQFVIRDTSVSNVFIWNWIYERFFSPFFTHLSTMKTKSLKLHIGIIFVKHNMEEEKSHNIIKIIVVLDRFKKMCHFPHEKVAISYISVLFIYPSEFREIPAIEIEMIFFI